MSTRMSMNDPAAIFARQVSDTFAAEVSGVDLVAPMTTTTFERILEIFYRYRVIFFPRQTISPRQLADFASKYWGNWCRHVLAFGSILSPQACRGDITLWLGMPVGGRQHEVRRHGRRICSIAGRYKEKDSWTANSAGPQLPLRRILSATSAADQSTEGCGAAGRTPASTHAPGYRGVSALRFGGFLFPHSRYGCRGGQETH